MKLATFSTGGGPPRVGLVLPEQDRIVDLAALAAARGGNPADFAAMDALIASAAPGLERLRVLAAAPDGGLPLNQVRLHAPLPVPAQIRDCSLAEQHIRDAPVGMARLKAQLAGQPAPSPEPTVPEIYHRQPLYYISNRFSVSGPEDTVQWPRYAAVMDFELEVAVVIGRGGKDIAPAGAAGHIFGYTLFNDFSARDQQAAEMAGGLGPTKGKSFDTGNAMGPWIVTADEIGIALDLPVRVRVNGDVWAEGRTTGMLHGIPQVLSFISSSETLHPGEVIALGTVGGCCGLEIGRFLQPGDVVELEAGPLGTLRNTVGMRQNTA